MRRDEYILSKTLGVHRLLTHKSKTLGLHRLLKYKTKSSDPI